MIPFLLFFLFFLRACQTHALSLRESLTKKIIIIADPKRNGLRRVSIIHSTVCTVSYNLHPDPELLSTTIPYNIIQDTPKNISGLSGQATRAAQPRLACVGKIKMFCPSVHPSVRHAGFFNVPPFAVPKKRSYNLLSTRGRKWGRTRK